MSDPVSWLAGLSVLQAGLLASLVAGLSTGLGALPALALGNLKPRTQDVMLGFSAGIMLAASSFSLLLPSVELAGERWGSPALGGLAGAVGALAGALALWLVHTRLPHEHFIKGAEGVSHGQIRRIWLFVLAITLHNFPEGLAVGVSFGGQRWDEGLAVTTGISLQNIPEGLAVALALLPLHYKRWQAVALAAGTGLAEWIAGALGAVAVSIGQAVLPWALAGAGGAMLFVLAHEVIPETHRNGHETPATFGLMVGFMVMMILDVGLG